MTTKIKKEYLRKNCLKLQEHWDDYLGDSRVLKHILKEKSENSMSWSVVNFFDNYYRSLGETVFVNNPFLGILILVSIFIGHAKAGLGCALGGLIATLTDQVLGLHPRSMLDSGVSSFNGSLLGTVLPALFHLVSDQESKLWVAVCFGSFVSVFISSALLNSLGKLNVPFMTLPFNFIAIISFVNFQSDEYSLPDESFSPSNDSIEWIRVLEGCVLSMGQVYAVQNLITSIIMWAAVFLYNPVVALLSALGAVIGTFLPLAFLDPSSYESVYTGLWGYSCILSMVAVSFACFPLSKKSIFVGFVNVLCTVFAQKALVTTLSKAKLPVFTLPFTLSTLLIVLSWNGQGQRWTMEKKQHDFNFIVDDNIRMNEKDSEKV